LFLVVRSINLCSADSGLFSARVTKRDKPRQGVMASTLKLLRNGPLASRCLGRLLTHRDDRKWFVVRADEKRTAFMELERAIHEFAVSLIS